MFIKKILTTLSFKEISSAARTAFLRFPLVIAFSSLAVVTSILLIEEYDYNDIRKLLLSSLIAIPLFLSFDLVAESQNFLRKRTLSIRLLGLTLWLGYYFYLPDVLTWWYLLQAFIFSLGLHFFVAVAPFLNNKDESSFWLFNKTLFLRFCLAFLYSNILFFGLFIALLSLQALFNIPISSRRYSELWVIIVGGFNTWFFLSGIPKNFLNKVLTVSFPKGLQYICQYTFIPLSILYLLILYAYNLKIIIRWSLPVGWVSYLVLSFSIVSIFSVLLIHPIKKSKRHTLIYYFSKYLYMSLVPLTVLLFTAIGKRLSDYGITELRYLVLVLAIWLVLITLQQILKKGQSIRFIPLSFAIFALLTCFGPVNARKISFNSQLGQIKTLLEKSKEIDSGHHERIHSILKYFEDRQAIHYLAQNLKVQPKNNTASSIARALNVEKGFNIPKKNSYLDKHFYYSLNPRAQIEIDGFQEMRFFDVYNYRQKRKSKTNLKAQNNLEINLENSFLLIRFSTVDQKIIEHTFDLKPTFEKINNSTPSKNNDLPVDSMRLNHIDQNIHLSVVLNNMSGKGPQDLKVEAVKGYVFWRLKNSRLLDR